ncbi:hypothetical protein [Actinomycetospora sp. CA-084318]|uniref:hypothetical protein n=1 Tax=Actinomycetospora sp. CA-084318 TaxID=3239892 RepID=UPI003D95AFB7
MTRTRLLVLVLGLAAAGVVLLSGCSGGDDLPLPAGVAVPGVTEASQNQPIAPPGVPVDDDLDDRDDRDDDRNDLDDRWDDDRDDLDDRDDDLDDDRDDDRDD